MAISDTSAVSARERRRAARAAVSPKALTSPAKGTAFAPDERLFSLYDSGTVFEYGEFDAVDIAEMLRVDGKARATFEVLSLPLRSARHTIEAASPDVGQTALVRENLSDKLPGLIESCTTGIGFRRAFFETTWALQAGKIVYDEIAWRPATGCDAGFDPATGAPKGFRQQLVPVGGRFPVGERTLPGYVVIAPARAFIYTHGAWREPIRGVSDLDVAAWCSTTKRKVAFLWFQYLENQAIPKTVVYGDDDTQAAALADDIAELKASGVLGLPRPGDPAAKVFDVLESSGRGAAEFHQAITYLDSMMLASVLAGFTELATAAASGTGSYALSADQSEFFLASRQAVADEIAAQITDGIIAPLVAHNFGPDAAVPKLTIGPLSNRTTERALSLLTAVIAAPALNVPAQFVDQLTESVSVYLGLDIDKVRAAIDEHAKARAEQNALKLAAQRQLLASGGAAAAAAQTKPGKPGQPPQPTAPKAPKPAAPTPAKPAAKPSLSDTDTAAVELAGQLLAAVDAGADPADALAELADNTTLATRTQED